MSEVSSFISVNVKTYEDLKITDPKEREKHFGQYDHVRLYGKDYPERIKKTGFNHKGYRNNWRLSVKTNFEIVSRTLSGFTMINF